MNANAMKSIVLKSIQKQNFQTSYPISTTQISEWFDIDKRLVYNVVIDIIKDNPLSMSHYGSTFDPVNVDEYNNPDMMYMMTGMGAIKVVNQLSGLIDGDLLQSFMSLVIDGILRYGENQRLMRHRSADETLSLINRSVPGLTQEQEHSMVYFADECANLVVENQEKLDMIEDQTDTINVLREQKDELIGFNNESDQEIKQLNQKISDLRNDMESFPNTENKKLKQKIKKLEQQIKSVKISEKSSSSIVEELIQMGDLAKILQHKRLIVKQTQMYAYLSHMGIVRSFISGTQKNGTPHKHYRIPLESSQFVTNNGTVSSIFFTPVGVEHVTNLFKNRKLDFEKKKEERRKEIETTLEKLQGEIKQLDFEESVGNEKLLSDFDN